MTDVVHSGIWEEEPEPDDPFAARACYLGGFDVYGELLGRVSLPEYLFLLFRGDPPTAAEARLLEALAVALANPGPRDPSVRAAMEGGAGGSGAAACLMAALAAGAGWLGGARDVRGWMELWAACAQSIPAWAQWRTHTGAGPVDVWLPPEHPPGFDPNGVTCRTPVRQALAALSALSPGAALPWLAREREGLEAALGRPLAMSGLAAAACVDLGLGPREGEMLALLLRLPGAAVHALEQKRRGWRSYPFFGAALQLTDDPLATAPE